MGKLQLRTDTLRLSSFIVFSTSMLFINFCSTFTKRIIHNLTCSDALCMSNTVQCTLYMIVLKMYVGLYVDLLLCSRLLETVESNFNTFTVIIIRYIHIRYTRFLAEVERRFEL